MIKFTWAKNRKAQSIGEYSILIFVVVSALLGVRIFMKRSIQGEIRRWTEQISPYQYEDTTTYAEFNTNSASVKDETAVAADTAVSFNDLTRSGGLEISAPEVVHE